MSLPKKKPPSRKPSKPNRNLSKSVPTSDTKKEGKIKKTLSKKVNPTQKALKDSQKPLPRPSEKSPKKLRSSTSSEGFPIVGVGASAGGFEAFTRFFSAVPANCGMGFVLVQHLAPNHDSLMPELLTKHTSMPVMTASDETPVEPNRVYVIPPNANLTIEGGILRVARPSQAYGQRTPIDNFFQSLAEDQGQFSICIILSGAGSDGTSGLRAVKEHGGLAIAQSAESAKFDSMPRSAILTGLVDHILTVEKMPGVLMNYAQHMSDLRAGKGLDYLREEALNYLDIICGHLRRRKGHDFRQYKRSTLGRRIQRRMQILHIDSAKKYVERLQQQEEEIDLLFKDLLIGVTQFFRDPEVFRILATDIVPKIIQMKKPGEPLRIWVPGCSTGEEAFSIAILFYENLRGKNISRNIQLFGTDIDNQGLEIARLGRYPDTIADHISPERLSRFFEKEGNSFRVVKAIRELCIFSPHNIIGDPPFSRMDLVSCRNLLIYMETELQHHILSLFHYSLKNGGYLLLGPSEHVAGHSQLFRGVHKTHRIFRVKEGGHRLPLNMRMKKAFRSTEEMPGLPMPGIQENVSQYFDRVARDEYGPAAALIDEDANIQYLSGQTQRFLQLPPGTLNVNIVNMVRTDLRLPLRSALHKAGKTGQIVIEKNIQVSCEDGLQHLDLIVRPLSDFKESSDFLMVVFQERGLVHLASDTPRSGRKASKEDNVVIRELEQEIKNTKEHLQTTVEELETSNEELKSSNEELLSMNEELQSANEELQTSKEELQSINEELETVNAELRMKVDELDQAHNDTEHLFQSTEIATVFLDTKFRIKKFTPAAQGIFRLIEADIGRPISDLATFFEDNTLHSDVEEVFRTSTPILKERGLRNGSPTYLSRIIPYRTTDNILQGAVLTFVDITPLRQVQEQVQRFSHQQSVLAAFGQLALQEYDLQAVMDACIHHLTRMFSTEFGHVLELQPGEDSLLLRAGLGWKEGVVGSAMVPAGKTSQAGYTLHSEEPVIVTDLSRETRFLATSLFLDHGIVSGMSCLIRDHEGSPHGILGIYSTTEKKFAEEDVKFLVAMANTLASGIHRNRIETELQSMTENLELRVEERTRDLVHHQKRVRNLSSELILTEQKERRRIAKELHDYLGQLLVVAKLKTAQLNKMKLSEEFSMIIKEIEESVNDAFSYTQDLIPQISPPILYEFGLMAALRWLAEKMGRYSLQVKVLSKLKDELLVFPEPMSVILYEVIRELFLNVVRHAQIAEACLEISPKGPDSISFEVTDCGCGFTLEPTIEGILKSQKFGLLNVEERIKDLGGQFHLQTRPGEGTRVLITVPYQIEKGEGQMRNVTTMEKPKRYRKKNEEGVITVVIADDHSIFRDGLRPLLDACPDIKVIGEAENGQQAVHLIQRVLPDVVVMDIDMPIMNGVEATRLVKERTPWIYIIGLSMHAEEVVSDSFSSVGGDRYVPKGHSSDSLIEIIRSSQQNSPSST